MNTVSTFQVYPFGLLTFHKVALVHSVMSGKKKTLFNGELINEAQKVSTEWSFAWSYGAHLLRVGINFDEYSLVIDGIPFSRQAMLSPLLGES